MGTRGQAQSARLLVWLGAVLGATAACGAKTGLTVDESQPRDPDCRPTAEVCNDLDDDCDGVVDDGIACFFLDGLRITAQATTRCGAAWYGYDFPDSESANPLPDIRRSGEVVVAVQAGDGCQGAHIGVIADLPNDGSGGQLLGEMTVTPPSPTVDVIGDELRECSYNRVSGFATCDWTWQNCCTDGALVGPLLGETCTEITLSNPVGVSSLSVLDGSGERISKAFGVPFTICTQIRPPVD